MTSNDDPKWRLLPRIVVLTNEALYIFEQHFSHMTLPELAGKPIPEILLRRRISLIEGQGIESISLSKFADPCVGLSISSSRNNIAVGGQGDKSSWVSDDKAFVCSVTGKPFTVFNRRHHW